MQGTETGAWGWERGARGKSRAGRIAHLQRVGCGVQPEGGARRQSGSHARPAPHKSPIKAPPAGRPRRDSRPAGRPRFLPRWVQGTRPSVYGGGAEWRGGSNLSKQISSGNASFLCGVNSGLWTHPYPPPEKQGERRSRWGGSRIRGQGEGELGWGRRFGDPGPAPHVSQRGGRRGMASPSRAGAKLRAGGS